MAVGLGLAAWLLWAFFRNADWPEVLRSLGGADLPLLGLCALGNALVLLLRSLRWRLMLGPLRPGLGFAPVWRSFTIGFVVSSLLPGRLGELLRPYLIDRDAGVGFAPAFATVVTERVVDLLFVLGLLGLGFIVPGALGAPPRSPAVAEAVSAIEDFALLALALALAVGLFLVILRARAEVALRALGWLASPLPGGARRWLLELISTFAEGLGVLDRPWRAALFLAATAATWLVLGLSTWAALAAFAIERPFTHILFLVSVLALGAAVPTPAGAGTYHAGAILVLGSLWGLNETMAATVAAFAIACHVTSYTPAILFGVASLLGEGLSSLVALVRAPPEPPASEP